MTEEQYQQAKALIGTVKVGYRLDLGLGEVGSINKNVANDLESLLSAAEKDGTVRKG